ncbi:hypothetical protein QWZ06_02870 [Chryseobacterium tructae]|uniref:PEGA domain-containing protein n=1 Tax=Chryseobacterium tructae TaxID=1037380 RepID=A0ABV7XRB6_9FLAO|nr:hypothetical protein [Chryseobacterium tructae]MDN3691273.1 hypothetical protein [Chryseobacterium tructae]
MMQGKIKIKLNQNFTFSKKKYKVFINENFIGELSNTNNRLDYLTTLGQHTILIQGNKTEWEQNIDLTFTKSILPMYIDDKSTEIYNNESKFLYRSLIGFAFIYLLAFVYGLWQLEIDNISLIGILPILITAMIIAPNKEKREFKLKFS